MRIPPPFTFLTLTLTLTLDLPLASAVALARLPLPPPATPVLLIPEDWTNAQRLAARLPPRAPQNLRRTPTRGSVPSPSPSPRLRVTKEGHIEVHDVHAGARVGFISSSGARLSADAELVNLEAADAGRSGTRFVGGTGPAA